jgi:hypothetical protein
MCPRGLASRYDLTIEVFLQVSYPLLLPGLTLSGSADNYESR